MDPLKENRINTTSPLLYVFLKKQENATYWMFMSKGLLDWYLNSELVMDKKKSIIVALCNEIRRL